MKQGAGQASSSTTNLQFYHFQKLNGKDCNWTSKMVFGCPHMFTHLFPEGNKVFFIPYNKSIEQACLDIGQALFSHFLHVYGP